MSMNDVKLLVHEGLGLAEEVREGVAPDHTYTQPSVGLLVTTLELGYILHITLR